MDGILCRTCMLFTHTDFGDEERSDEVKMHSIYNVPEQIKEEYLSLKELLKTIVPQLKFEEDDKLPKDVCHCCSEKIIQFYIFQQMCLKNEEKLYKYFDADEDSEFYMHATLVKTELIENSFNENKNILCSKRARDKPDNISSEKINDSARSLDVKKGNPSKRKRKSNVKKKLNKSSSKRSSRYVKRGPKKLYSCDICQRKLKSELYLAKHKEMHLRKEMEVKQLKCKACYQVFTDIATLKEHQRACEKPFVCSECGKHLASAGSLAQHTFLHLGIKPYTCPGCPKSFSLKANFLSHQLIHKARPKTHICDECGSGFYSSYLLKRHKLYHNDERPFKCEFCKKGFITSAKLQRHVRTHTGEKPYPCMYCNKSFGGSSVRAKHLKQHLGDNIYPCELCPLRFPLLRSMRAHFATHKDDDDETRSRNLMARVEEEQRLLEKFSK